MIRSRLVPPRFVQLAAVVAVILIFGRVRAAEPETESQRVAKALDKIEQRLNLMDTRLDTALDVAKDVRQLREDVNRLQREVGGLRRTGPGTTSSSFYSGPPAATTIVPPASLAITPPPAQTGRVRLVNNYLSEMTATVNGVTVVVPPMQARDVVVPAGALNYQVYQVPQAVRATTISPNEMVTLTLFPAV
jgi:hypothetical protein